MNINDTNDLVCLKSVDFKNLEFFAIYPISHMFVKYGVLVLIMFSILPTARTCKFLVRTCWYIFGN